MEGWDPQVEAGRLAERDPLVLAWLESLGDEAGAAMPSWTTPPRESADGRELAIVAPDVACRAAPAARGTLRGATLRLDHHFTAERADTTVSGEDWTFVWDGCWVPASQTAPGDTDEHIRAIVDRFISADDGRSTGNPLRVYNVLSGRKTGHRDAVDASGLLSLRRLELIDDWLGTFTFFNADPLTLAVVRSLEEEVAYFEPGGMWTLRDDAFLTLYERHRDGPEAHEVLWKLANGGAHNDCEGEFACYVRALILNRVGRYWVEYPGGPHVTEAVTRARDRLQWWLDGCSAARDAEPGSREARWSEVVGWEGRGEEAVAELRRSLEEVAEEVRRPLVEVLDGLEGCAALDGASAFANLGQQFLPRLAFDDLITDTGDRLWIGNVVQHPGQALGGPCTELQPRLTANQVGTPFHPAPSEPLPMRLLLLSRADCLNVAKYRADG